MDRNTIIGFGLIFLLLMGMQYFQQGNRVKEAQEKRTQDSIAQIAITKDSLDRAAIQQNTTVVLDSAQIAIQDSINQLQRAQSFGNFSAAAIGTEEESVLENDLIKVTFSNKGGRIKSVLLKEYFKMGTVEEGDKKYPLYLLENEKNKFEYTLPLASGAKILSSDLYFDAEKSVSSIVFRAKVSDNQYFEQKYELTDGTYVIDYDLKFNGLENVLARDAEVVQLNWENYLDKVERNVDYERRMSSVYFKTVEDDADYCNCNKSDIERIDEERLSWVAHSSQFFNSALLTTDVPFQSGVMETVVPENGEEVEYLKKLISQVDIPTKAITDGFDMQIYAGPKEYDRLVALGNELEYTVPFGISVFGTVNRYIIRPVFGFLLSFISSKGIVILLLTLIVKLVLFPLTYKMLYSQAKMAALKPQIAKVKEKNKDDSQQQQVETMKMYREFGVNPLGGCMPMVLQMPIWFALYRFFPASIEFRQSSFLWAHDLSSFDVFALLPFSIPFYGSHVSLFTILWAIATIAYTVYNSKNMDMSAMNSNPAMKYMQYFMPVMFLFFFNNFASGLTCYLLFSSIFNILQTVITKNVIINHDKVKRELEEHRKKPKKKGGFQERLEKAMKQQQQVQEDRQKRGTTASGRKKKKK